MNLIEVTISGIGAESIIFIGIAFWLVYFSTTFNSSWLKLVLKLLSTLIIIQVAYIPLIQVNLGNQISFYDMFAFMIANGIYLFWAIWFVILLKESLDYFTNKKKEKMEEVE